MWVVVESGGSRWGQVFLHEVEIGVVRFVSDHRPLAILIVSPLGEGTQVSASLFGSRTQVLRDEEIPRFHGRSSVSGLRLQGLTQLLRGYEILVFEEVLVSEKLDRIGMRRCFTYGLQIL